MSDIIRKKGAKFIKQLEKQLNERGYELVSYEFGSRKKHGTLTVKNPETQEIVESTFSLMIFDLVTFYCVRSNFYHLHFLHLKTRLHYFLP